MNQWIQRLILTAAGCALFAQPASAQPSSQKTASRDHRKPAKAVPAPVGPASPASRDHRNKTKPGERDHRNKTKPGERDHRDGKAKGDDSEAGKPMPESRDHRGAKPGHDAKLTTPGEPEVRDHRSSGARVPVPAPVTGRNEVVPSVRGRSHKRWSAYEIPVVKRYWPSKGKAGTTVTVLGANFGPKLAVYYGETAVSDATITPTTITFAIPAMLRTDSLRPVERAGVPSRLVPLR